MIERYDLVLRGATLIDGTGTPARTADVGVAGDTILALGDVSAGGAGRVVDAAGLMLAPGFIDMHSHSDWTLLIDPAAESKVRVAIDGDAHTGALAGGVLRRA